MVIWIGFVVSLACYLTCVRGAAEIYEIEEGKNVSLSCDFIKHNLSYPGIPTPFIKVWVLPNTTVLYQTFLGDGKYSVHQPDSFTFDLRINDVNKDDFGVYHCMMLWNNINYAMGAIRVGLNEDYPYYRKRYETLRLATIIAGSAVGVIFLAVLIAFCIWRNRRNGSNGGVREVTTSRRPSDGYSQQNTARMRTCYAYDVGHGKDGHLGSEGYKRDADVHRNEPEVEVYSTVNSQRCLHMEQKESPCYYNHDNSKDIVARM